MAEPVIRASNGSPTKWQKKQSGSWKDVPDMPDDQLTEVEIEGGTVTQIKGNKVVVALDATYKMWFRP